MTEAQANHSSIEVDVVADDFAAEVRGVDLSRPLSASTLEELHTAWGRYPVLAFPDQPLTHEALEAFTLALGPYGVDPFVQPMPGHPNILEVRREASEQGLIFGNAWHSDWSFQETPPSATLLHAKVVPPVGGDTLYADCRAAYEKLPTQLREWAHGARAVHTASGPYGETGSFARDDSPRAMTILKSKEAHATQAHPVIRAHPTTGRKAIFVNPVYTRWIDGISREESRARLDALFEHCLQEEFILRHQWRENMLVLWDNRCTMHNAQGGYEGHERVLHRTTIRGERPTA